MKSKVLLMLLDRIQKIEDRVKKLEQAQTYFPMEYHKINRTDYVYNNAIGGVDNIKIGLTDPD